jgi:hypothetical protein
VQNIDVVMIWRGKIMIYTDRKYLTILELQDDSDTVSFDVLKELLMERPSNMIYCEKYPGGYMGS